MLGPALAVARRELAGAHRAGVGESGLGELGAVGRGGDLDAVRGGVAEDEWVVALGAQKLDAAQAVRVVESLRF